MANGQNLQLALEIGVPVAAVLLSAWGAYAVKVAPMIAAKTHSELLGHIAAASGGIAAQIADVLAAQPPNVDRAALRTALVNLAATNVAPMTATALGAVNPVVASMISTELAKMPMASTAPVASIVAPVAPVVAP